MIYERPNATCPVETSANNDSNRSMPLTSTDRDEVSGEISRFL